MTKQKLKLNMEIVKYIFPGLHPQIALGNGGWVVYDFDRLLPRKLGIMVPTNIESSNYSQILPTPFDSYFKNLQDAVSHFSRLIETPIILSVPGVEIEGIIGGLLDYNKSEYTVFCFDDSLETPEKKYVLCRTKANQLSVNDSVAIINTNPVFKESAIDFYGNEYVYWIMPITSLFAEPQKVLLATLAYAGFLQ